MKPQIQRVGLISRTDWKEALDLSLKLIECLGRGGLQVLLEPELAKSIGREGLAKPVEKMNVDLVITVGGDGTILRTCLSLPKPEPPILSINLGVRGFLAEVESDDAFKALDEYLSGRLAVERRPRLASFIGEERLPDALNEVFVTAGAPAKLLHVKVRKNGVEVDECLADGIIIASQVGSTGYSLSAGGPVLDPELEAFVLTPVCALVPFRPIVFPSKSVLTIELIRPSRALVVIDGHYQREIDLGGPPLIVTKSEREARFVQFKRDFYERLRSRFLFRGRKLNEA